jgi:molybdopterin synthase catalytic subunit
MSEHKSTHLTSKPMAIDEWHAAAVDERDGASVEFLGIVRSEESGKPISHLDYEAYEPMAERVIERLVKQARERWPLHAVCVRHRVGRVAVGEVAVLIGVRASHRDEAFEACRFLIDAVKRDVPIWKAAVRQDGRRLHPTPCWGSAQPIRIATRSGRRPTSRAWDQPTCADGHETR